jgi:hypothetical protein
MARGQCHNLLAPAVEKPRYSNARRNLLASGRFGLDLELAVSGGGNYHDRAKAPSKPTQELRENVAVPFQSIGSRGSPVSTLIVLPMTSLGSVGANS